MWKCCFVFGCRFASESLTEICAWNLFARCNFVHNSCYNCTDGETFCFLKTSSSSDSLIIIRVLSPVSCEVVTNAWLAFRLVLLADLLQSPTFSLVDWWEDVVEASAGFQPNAVRACWAEKRGCRSYIRLSVFKARKSRKAVVNAISHWHASNYFH